MCEFGARYFGCLDEVKVSKKFKFIDLGKRMGTKEHSLH